MPILGTFSSMLPTWDLWVIKDVVSGGSVQHPSSFFTRHMHYFGLLPQPFLSSGPGMYTRLRVLDNL